MEHYRRLGCFGGPAAGRCRRSRCRRAVRPAHPNGLAAAADRSDGADEPGHDRRYRLRHPGGAGRRRRRRQLLAVVSDPRHRDLDPDRRNGRRNHRLLRAERTAEQDAERRRRDHRQSGDAGAERIRPGRARIRDRVSSCRCRSLIRAATASSSRRRRSRASMSKRGRRPPGASRGPSSRSTSRAAAISAATRCRAWRIRSCRGFDMLTGRSAGFSPVRPTRISAIPTPSPKPWLSAARRARPGSSAYPSCATPLTDPGAAPGRWRWRRRKPTC